MGLDIRWPIGLMFSLIGALLTGYGAMTSSDTEMYKRSLGINIDLRWGIVLLVFGVIMLLLALGGKAKDTPTTPENKV
jgi:hypothetical protein